MARVRNATKDVDLATDARIAKTFWSRMVGLLGRRRLDAGEALVIEPSSSIHTAFMRFPIDVVYFDRDWRVRKVVSDLRPFRLSGVLRGGFAVIELPTGTIEATNTQPGDQLELQTDAGS